MTTHSLTARDVARAAPQFFPGALDKKEMEICEGWTYPLVVYEALDAWVTQRNAGSKRGRAYHLMAACRRDGMSPIDACQKIREQIFDEYDVH